MPNMLRVRLSLKGRPIKTFTFDQKDVSIGRDPESDICLDNVGISRAHARIERTPGGYVLEDLGSANGTFLNEQPVRREFIGHDDVVQIGKFALWVGVETNRRERGHASDKSPGPAVYEGTIVLDPDSLMDMQRKSREAPTEGAAPALTPLPARDGASAPPSGGRVAVIAAAAFAVGVVVGALFMWHVGGA